MIRPADFASEYEPITFMSGNSRLTRNNHSPAISATRAFLHPSSFILHPSLLPLLLLIAATTYAQESASSVSKPARLDLTDRPPFPAAIQIVGEPVFTEPSGNRALDALESGTLTLKLKNISPYKGNVTIKITPLTPLNNVTMSRVHAPGIIEGNAEKTVPIPIDAGFDIASEEHRIRIEVMETYYRVDPSPIVFTFTTRAFRPPEFHIVLQDVNDARDPAFPANNNDGRISLTEAVRFKVGVQNIGQGSGENVSVNLTIIGEGPNLFYRRDMQGSDNHTFDLKTLAPGGFGECAFLLFTNPFFRQDSLAIRVEVAEKHNRYGKTKTLTVPINLPVATDRLIAVQPEAETSVAIGRLSGGLVDVDEIPRGSRTRMPDGIAIIVGVESYRHTVEANYKARDAAVFYEYCRQTLGIPEDRILLRLNDDATKAEFDYVFEPAGSAKDGWLKKRIQPGVSDVVVYLGGHGFPDIATGKPYFIPQDVRPDQATNGLALENLYRTLAEMNPRTVTLFVESCFSGMSGYQTRPQTLAMNMNPVLPRMKGEITDPRFAVFTAASGMQASYNRADLKHGIFTYFVLKGLGGAADANRDRAVTVAELQAYLAREVPRKALEPPLDKQQEPSLMPDPAIIGDRIHRVLVQY